VIGTVGVEKLDMYMRLPVESESLFPFITCTPIVGQYQGGGSKLVTVNRYMCIGIEL
jgi:hypothetical protein